MGHAIEMGLGQIPTMRVHWQCTHRTKVTCFDERPAFPLGTKPIIFELYEHAIRRIVVQQGYINILGAHASGPERLLP